MRERKRNPVTHHATMRAVRRRRPAVALALAIAVIAAACTPGMEAAPAGHSVLHLFSRVSLSFLLPGLHSARGAEGHQGRHGRRSWWIGRLGRLGRQGPRPVPPVSRAGAAPRSAGGKAFTQSKRQHRHLSSLPPPACPLHLHMVERANDMHHHACKGRTGPADERYVTCMCSRSKKYLAKLSWLELAPGSSL